MAAGVRDLGVGIGLRVPHYRSILDDHPAVDVFEIISENFMVEGGKPRFHLGAVLERYPVVQHGVSLGIGGPGPLDRDYLARLRRLVRETGTPWVSDHFCWSSVPGVALHDLLPLPFTPAMVRRVAERARQVQDLLEVPFALENASSYAAFRASTMTEWEFVTEVCERAGVGLMLDVNNVYVTSYNHGLDPEEFLRGLPLHRVVQVHLAGHTNLGTHLLDTHSTHVIDPVWRLYEAAVERTGPVTTILEWDDDIPALEVVLAEAEKARTSRSAALARRAAVERGEPAAPRPRVTVAREAARPGPSGWRQGGPRELVTDG
ncbi:MAG: DUF692 domain-containing protein [Polyangiaceae bacterium]|nr:DUF692 domain-containing protein [Polyangiaceae bacterium]